MPCDTIRRGYDARHNRLRAQVKPQVEAGRITCWRCRKRILPGQPWDLGHHDTDRRAYMGPEHRACNRGASRRKHIQAPKALAFFKVS